MIRAWHGPKPILRGLLLDADDNKNAETIALNAYGGDTSQVRMTQHFLGQSPWPYLPLRAELVRWVDEDLGDAEGVLIVDESGVAKCGDKSVGVARQYCGATGKIDNCQIGVFLAYASRHGHTLLDARLYLPEEEWANDAARRQAAGVPPDVVFRTKPQLAAELVLGPGQAIRHGWVSFDEGYGKDPVFLSRLEEAGERYIGEVPKSVRAWLQRPVVEEPGPGAKGRPRHKPRVRADQPAPQTVEQMAAALPARAWQRLAFREGTQGVQRAEFARIRVVVGARRSARAGVVAGGRAQFGAGAEDQVLPEQRSGRRAVADAGPSRSYALAGGGLFFARQTRSGTGCL